MFVGHRLFFVCINILLITQTHAVLQMDTQAKQSADDGGKQI